MRNSFFIIFAIILASCHHVPECKNHDPVFDQFGPTDQPYKEELLKQIQRTDPAKVHYIIDNYADMQKRPYVSILVRADSFCAQMFIDLKNPNKMAHFKTVKGLSFVGKEIKGLQYKTDTINGQYNFVFEEGMINGKKQ